MQFKHKISTVAFLICFNTQAMASTTEIDKIHEIFNACVAADGSIQCLDYKGKQDLRRLEHMTTLMKLAIVNNPDDPIIRNNVLNLYNQAYDLLKSHQLNPEWHLPAEIHDMNITVRRTLSDNVKYSLVVRGRAVQPKYFKQYQIVQYPDKVLIDKQAGIGKWIEESDGIKTKYGIESNRTAHKLETGLYLLNIELKNGAKTQGWFLVDDTMNNNTSPIIQTPAPGQVFKTRTPTLKWKTYVSQYYKAYEHKLFWCGVSKMEPEKEVWDTRQVNPHLEQATLNTELENGDYIFSLDYKELKSFGDIEIGRASSVAGRAFKIQAQ